jgi:hypothetical protein
LDVTAVAPPPGNQDALAWLLEITGQLVPLFHAPDFGPTQFETAPGTTAPAYRITVTEQVPED